MILGSKRNNREVTAIVVGAILADATLIIFYFIHLLLGTPESAIWSVAYYQPKWQLVFDLAHSIPLALLGLLICWKTSRPCLLLLFASMLLHALGDLPLHHDDAHRHFLPLSDWRFLSPVSYWNPAYHGNWGSLLEIFAVVTASIFLYLKRPQLKNWVVGIGTVYLLYWAYVVVIWL